MSEINLKAMPQQVVELAEPMPPGFNPLSATNDELLKYGLPPPPSKEHSPEQYRQWKEAFAQLPCRAPSVSFEAVSRGSAPPQQTLGQPHDDEGSPQQDGNWCGAINRDLPAGYQFKTVSASLVAPRPYPPSSVTTTDSGSDSSTSSAEVWIGIDGYGIGTDTPFGKIYELLRAGMTQRCVTSSNGSVQSTTTAWIAWLTQYPYRIEASGFFINPGDVVTVMIGDHSNSTFSLSTARVPSSRTTVFFYNRSTGSYFGVRVPSPGLASLAQSSVKWIVECSDDPEADADDSGEEDLGQDPAMPFLGATFFYDCCAAASSVVVSGSTRTETWIERNLSTATLLDLVQDGAVVSRAVRENDTVLGVFGASGPSSTLRSNSTAFSPRTVVHYQSEASLLPLMYIPLATGKQNASLYVLIGTIHLGTDDNGLYIHLNESSPDDASYNTLWEEVKTLQFYGVKVLGRIGGARDNSFADLAIPADGQDDNFEQYYALLRGLLDTHHLDGLDLNVEQAISQDSINRIVDRLSSDYDRRRFIITMSPVGQELRGHPRPGGIDYDKLESSRGSKISWYNAQVYNGFDTSYYEDIINRGVFKPSKVLAGFLTAYRPAKDFKGVLQALMKEYPTFGGVAGWEYAGSKPRPTVAPWQWFLDMQDILSWQA